MKRKSLEAERADAGAISWVVIVSKNSISNSPLEMGGLFVVGRWLFQEVQLGEPPRLRGLMHGYSIGVRFRFVGPHTPIGNYLIPCILF